MIVLNQRLTTLTCRLVLLASFCAGALRGASERHVNQQHSGAKDTNPGTPEMPLKTIGAAVQSLQAGDRIWIHAGTYREQVEFKAVGEDWVKPIVVAAWPGDTVTIKGSNTVTGWAKHGGDIWKKESWEHNTQLVFSDDKILQQIGGEMVDYLTTGNRWRGRVGNGLNDMTEGSFYVDLEGKTLYVWLPDGSAPDDHTIEASVRPFLLVADGSYFIIRDLNMSHSNTSAKVNWPAVRIGGSHIIFSRCDVSWADFIGLGIRGEYIDILDSTFNYCGNSGIGGNCYRGCRLIGNETSHNNWRNWSSGWHAGGFKLIPVHRHLIVERHRAFHNNSDGMWIDSLDSSNITINSCESAYNKGNGLHYEIGQRGVVTNNLFHHNTGRGIYLSSSSEMLVAHNVCYANGMSGIVSHGVKRNVSVNRHPKGIVPARNNRIIGNILMDNLNPALKPEGWNYRPELILPNPDNDPELFGGCFSDYNVYFRSDGRKIPFWYVWGEKVWHSLDRWREETGNDRHSVLASPLFADPEHGDFHLEPNSPAIGLVPILGELGEDRDGAQRPSHKKNHYRCAGIYTVDDAINPPRENVTPLPSGQKGPGKSPEGVKTVRFDQQGRLVPPDPASLKIDTVAIPDVSRQALGKHNSALSQLAVPLKGAHFHAGGLLFDLGDDVPSAEIRTESALTVAVNTNALTIYTLLAVTGKGEIQGSVARGDGIAKAIALRPGENIPNSIGNAAEAAKIYDVGDGCATASLAWQGQLKDRTPARLYLITYVNDNPWLPVLKLDWKATGDASCAILSILRGN